MLNAEPYQIFPSLLAADPMALGQEVDAVIKTGIKTIHLDVMDNHYVPNMTYGPLVCEALRRRFPNLCIDVHLMVTPVDDLIQQFAHAGATRLSIHPEATLHLDRSLQLIRSLGCQAGLVFNPATSLEYMTWCHHHLDFVLVMTVNPGFGGQKLIPEVIPKIRQLRHGYQDLAICVDGGISLKNISEIAKAGANEFVIGSAIFGTDDYAKTIKGFRQVLSSPSL